MIIKEIDVPKLTRPVLCFASLFVTILIKIKAKEKVVRVRNSEICAIISWCNIPTNNHCSTVGGGKTVPRLSVHLVSVLSCMYVIRKFSLSSDQDE